MPQPETTGNVIAQDQVIIVTFGCYDGYHLGGLWRATTDVAVEDEQSAFLKAFPPADDARSFNAERFFKWLAQRGLFKPEPYQEFHVDDSIPNRPQIGGYYTREELDAMRSAQPEFFEAIGRTRYSYD